METPSKSQIKRDIKALKRLMSDGKSRNSQDIALAAGEGMYPAISQMVDAGDMIATKTGDKFTYQMA
jgi:ribosomal 50S subunit-associated protein YjgA (DUF615 family)